MTIELPQFSVEALRTYQDMTSDLHQWAPTVHRLVRERISALMAAYGPFQGLETPEEHARRVLAGGQEPFPDGVSIYENLNDNRGYDHVDIGYGTGSDGGFRVTFSGWYPEWAADGESYQRRWAVIHCPGWLVTEADGISRYRAETQRMVAEVKEERVAEDAKIEALIEQMVRRMGNKGGETVS